MLANKKINENRFGEPERHSPVIQGNANEAFAREKMAAKP